jgi:hypothetical protein
MFVSSSRRKLKVDRIVRNGPIRRLSSTSRSVCGVYRHMKPSTRRRPARSAASKPSSTSAGRRV